MDHLKNVKTFTFLCKSTYAQNLFIAFKIGNGWAWSTVLAVGVVNYMYKFTMAIVLTPLIHLIRNRIENYVGAEAAEKMKREAMGEDANI